MKKGNSLNNKRKKKYNWEYHEKLNQKYELYLIENKDKNNLRLKGNYHYENKPLNYYLYKKDLEPINNSNLTPLPQSKYLNNKITEKNKDDYKKFANIQKSVVEMRRIEYNANLNKIKRKGKINEHEEEIVNHFEEFKKMSVHMKKSIKNRKSCIQFGYNIKLSDKKRKTMNLKDIIEYIIKNAGKTEIDNMPKEVKVYLLKLIPALKKIQRSYKKHYQNLKKILKIQASYKAHLYSELFKDYLKRKEKISKFIFIIQKVLFLNLYHLKINPNPKYASQKCLMTKYIYTKEHLNKIIFLQNQIKTHLSHKKLKRIYGKKKCVYIKPYTINPLGTIIYLQRNVILFLERLKRRHALPTSQIIFKKKIYTKKLILIQRFAKCIHEEIVYPPIPKDLFNQNNIYVKGNRKNAQKKVNFIETKIIPFNQKKINMRVKNKDSTIKKFHKHLEKLIFLQRNIKIYLSREDYDIYDYPKSEEYITKDCFVLPHNDHILLLQRQIKYFLYRQKVKEKTKKKVVIFPLKITKSIRTNTEKIFMRLSKLRIMYDKNMILFIVTFIETIRKSLGKFSFDIIREESKKRKIFSLRGGKYKNTFAKSNLIKNAVFKVVEAQYKLEPVKPKDQKFFSNKNNSILSILKLGKKSDLEIAEKSKTKRSDKSDKSDRLIINEKIDERDEHNEEKEEKEDEKNEDVKSNKKKSNDNDNKNDEN